MTLRRLELGLLDNRLAQHLSMNGAISDQVGRELCEKFIHVALTDNTMREAAQRYGFTRADLEKVYVRMIECLLPNPCIVQQGRILAASLPFMEPQRLEGFMETVHEQFPPRVSARAKSVLIKSAAASFAQIIWDRHTKQHGEAPFSIDPTGLGRDSSTGGCGLVALAGLSGAGLIGWTLLRSLQA